MTTLDKRNTEIEEAAEYWDTHSVTDDNTEPVAEPIIAKKPLTSVFSIRLDRDDVAKLRALARANGIGPTTMARNLLRRSINGKPRRRQGEADYQIHDRPRYGARKLRRVRYQACGSYRISGIKYNSAQSSTVIYLSRVPQATSDTGVNPNLHSNLADEFMMAEHK